MEKTWSPGRWPSIVVLTLFLTAAACAPARAPEEELPVPPLNRDPKTLVVTVDASPDDFDPASSYTQASNVVFRGLYEGLVRLKGSSVEEIEPVLAESWETNENQSVWTFHLRSGVKFHDGTPFNAQAVKENYVRMVTLGFGPGYILGRWLTDPDNQISVVDPLTVQFDLGIPAPTFGLALAAAYGTGIVSPAVFAEQDKEGDQGHEWLLSNAVGTGPYMLESHEPNQETVLVRFPDYSRGWEGDHFDRIIIRVVPEPSTRRQLMEQGDADIAIPGTAEDVEALRRDGRFQVGDQITYQYDYIVMGEYGPLESIEARQALSYLFDYSGYVDGIRLGQGEIGRGPFPKMLLGWDREVFQYTYDLEKARDLLEEAGLVPGTRLTYLYYAGFGGEAGLILQGALAEFGIELELQEREISAFNGVFYGDQPAEERPDLFYYAWWPDYNDPANYAWPLFHSDAWGSAGANAGYYSNDGVDELVDALFSATNLEELTTLAQDLQRVLVEDPAQIYIYNVPDQSILRNDIKGHVFNPLYILTWDYYALSRSS